MKVFLKIFLTQSFRNYFFQGNNTSVCTRRNKGPSGKFILENEFFIILVHAKPRLFDWKHCKLICHICIPFKKKYLTHGLDSFSWVRCFFPLLIVEKSTKFNTLLRTHWQCAGWPGHWKWTRIKQKMYHFE